MKARKDLEAMEPDDLMQFTRRATADLANYAINLATAMQCRLRGEIETALTYEAIVDSIWAKLPDFARW
jgi:hypothetical protein